MSNALLNRSTYLFVDGAHFRKYFNETTTKWFGQEVEFDFKKIKDFFQSQKAFYYDCLDDIKGDNENQKDFETRVQAQEDKLNKIREVEGCHVFLGSISGKNKKKRQKEVDVMLSVHMMEHAFRGNMQKAILISGDKDFRPLVESLVRLGLFVEVVGDYKHISQDLIHSADSHKKLNIDEYLTFINPQHSPSKSFQYNPLSFFLNKYKEDGFFLIKQGIFNEIDEAYVFARNNGDGSWFTTNNSQIHNNSAWVTQDLETLIQYFELKYGHIDWR